MAPSHGNQCQHPISHHRSLRRVNYGSIVMVAMFSLSDSQKAEVSFTNVGILDLSALRVSQGSSARLPSCPKVKYYLRRKAMKFEINIDLPANVAVKWRPVAYRRVQKGEWYFNDRIVAVCNFQYSDPVTPHYIILQSIATWPEWPKWLTAPFVVSTRRNIWFACDTEPLKVKLGWSFGNTPIDLNWLAQFTNLTLPTYDGPWEHSLIRNPHLMKECYYCGEPCREIYQSVFDNDKVFCTKECADKYDSNCDMPT